MPCDLDVVAALQLFLSNINKDARLWIAYSGGVDSHVLLHGLHHLRPNVSLNAIHVNHQLQAVASSWAAHCQDVCRQLAIPFYLENVNIQTKPGESQEAVARHARYKLLKTYVSPGDYLLTAHHLQDQAETCLLQLLRGAGPKGLAAMPALTSFADAAHLARPLLHVDKRMIVDYARTHQLNWVDDASNEDVSYDRNFIRHQILPLLRQRRPSLDKALARSARHCAEATALSNALAEMDFVAIKIDGEQGISATQLKKLSAMRQRNVIRYWLQQQGIVLPSEVKMTHILQDIIYSRHQARPCVTWGNYAIKRVKDHIFLLAESN
ncbi:MAG: tRNA lysidine(34) synthetase TilS [Pseudomonadota bacterium]